MNIDPSELCESNVEILISLFIIMLTSKMFSCLIHKVNELVSAMCIVLQFYMLYFPFYYYNFLSIAHLVKHIDIGVRPMGLGGLQPPPL